MPREAPSKAFLCLTWDPLCDWEVAGSDAIEVLAAARDHLRRKHGAQLTIEELRRHLYDVREPIHTRVRGI